MPALDWLSCRRLGPPTPAAEVETGSIALGYHGHPRARACTRLHFHSTCRLPLESLSNFADALNVTCTTPKPLGRFCFHIVNLPVGHKSELRHDERADPAKLLLTTGTLSLDIKFVSALKLVAVATHPIFEFLKFPFR